MSFLIGNHSVLPVGWLETIHIIRQYSTHSDLSFKLLHEGLAKSVNHGLHLLPQDLNLQWAALFVHLHLFSAGPKMGKWDSCGLITSFSHTPATLAQLSQSTTYNSKILL